MQTDRIWTLLSRKLAGEANDADLLELEHILSEHPDYQFEVDAITQSWENKPTLDQDFLEATYLQHIERMKEKGILPESGVQPAAKNTPDDQHISSRRRISKTGLFMIGTTMMVIISSSWYFYRYSGRDVKTPGMAVVPRQIKTQNGSRSKEILPDGSTVWLNAGSKLVYGKDFGVEIREVHLTGEAFFDIVKNPEKPFVVHAGSIDIRVLGTAFNVRNYPDDKTTETSLLRGSVEITTQKRPGEKWMLKPNEKLVLLKDQAAPSPDRALPKKYSERLPLVVKKELTYQPGDSIAVEMAWVRNKLTFEDESFEEVAKKLERWYDIEIEFRDLVKKDLVLHNTFQNETLEEVMAALEFSLNFRYRIEGRKVIIY